MRDARVISVVLLALLIAGFLISEAVRRETRDRLMPECQLRNITYAQVRECAVTSQMQTRTRSFQSGAGDIRIQEFRVQEFRVQEFASESSRPTVRASRELRNSRFR